MKEKLHLFLLTVVLACGCTSVDRTNPSALRHKAREYDNMATELRELADKLENSTKLTRQKAPKVAVTYYPYEESQYRATGGPFPNYNNWTDSRMRKDLLRISNAGIDLVLVKASIAKSRNTEVAERYQRFFEIAASDPSYPKIALFTDCSTSNQSRINLFVSWCAMQDLELNKNYYQVKGRPLLILINGQKFSGISHPALTIKTAGTNGDWSWTSNPITQPIVPTTGNGQTMIFAGFNSPNHPENWLLDRTEGKNLATTFHKAASNNQKLIVIESWNNYQNGSYIEPNTRDKFTLYQLIQNEIQRLNH